MQKKTRALATEASETPMTKVENPELDLILHFVNIEHLWSADTHTSPFYFALSIEQLGKLT